MTPRLLPDELLPPYAYVPGLFPHPVSDPAGHSYQHSPEKAEAPDPVRWADCRLYLRGLDLFNHGYYWEAHEAWETLWHACGRRGSCADFLKALIQLAAAGVKVREGKPAGVLSHARRAVELLNAVARSIAAHDYMGLNLSDLIGHADDVARQPPTIGEDALGQPAMAVFPFVIQPRS